jgi:hypothetical protein
MDLNPSCIRGQSKILWREVYACMIIFLLAHKVYMCLTEIYVCGAEIYMWVKCDVLIVDQMYIDLKS